MGIIYSTCVTVGYNKNWQRRCQELAQGNCKSLRNQKKFNDAKLLMETQRKVIDLLDLAALVSSTQSGSDINGTGGGNQFCDVLTTPFPFSLMLGKNFENGQTAKAFANAYENIQSHHHSGNSAESHEVTGVNQTDFSASYQPCKEDFETAYRKLSRLGESVFIDDVLDQIEIIAKEGEYSLNNNWRIITEKNIEIWSQKK
jgi:hypothetical protein